MVETAAARCVFAPTWRRERLERQLREAKSRRWARVRGAVIVGAGIAAVAWAVWYFIMPKVDGTVSASGRLMGTWTTSLNSCQRDRDALRGVDLFADNDNDVLRATDSEESGLSVFVTQGLTGKKLQRWGSKDCKVLKGSVTVDESTTVNGENPVDGSVDFDCTANIDGSPEHVSGHVTFKHCI